jgi:L-galactono-1,4-lactone dehydrogenase
MGVAAEVTMQCVKAHRLLEKTWVATHAEIDANHEAYLKDYQHIRYMWVPHTETVVVVVGLYNLNPADP